MIMHVSAANADDGVLSVDLPRELVPAALAAIRTMPFETMNGFVKKP